MSDSNFGDDPHDLTNLDTHDPTNLDMSVLTSSSPNSSFVKLNPPTAKKDLKMIELIDLVSSNSSPESLEPGPSRPKKAKKAGKDDKKAADSSEVKFIGEYLQSYQKRRVRQSIYSESIATMRLILRRSINSQFYYQMLVKQVRKKYSNQETTLSEPTFDFLELVLEDIWEVEKLYDKEYVTKNARGKEIELFNRPKNLVELLKIIEKARTRFNFTDLHEKKYFKMRKERQRRKKISARTNQLCPNGQPLITLEELIKQLSQPLGFVNLTFSEESSDDAF